MKRIIEKYNNYFLTIITLLNVNLVNSIFAQPVSLDKSFEISETNCESCNAALNPELKKVNIDIKEVEIRNWLSEYFQSSEERRREMKSQGSTSASIAAIIQSIPVSFGVNSNSSESDKYWYSKYITWSRNQYISIDDIYYAYQSVLPEIAWTTWLHCKEISCGTLNLSGVDLKISSPRKGNYLIELFNFSDNNIKINNVDFDNLVIDSEQSLKKNSKITAFKGSATALASSKYGLEEPFTVSIKYTISNGNGTSPTITKTWTPTPIEVRSELPIGTILAWAHPTLGSTSSLEKIKEYIPKGWILCDGSDSRAPDLSDRFLKGADDNLSDFKTFGGNREHFHSGTTGSAAGGAHSTDGSHNPASPPTHTHSFTTGKAENIPPFYSVLYIMKLE